MRYGSLGVAGAIVLAALALDLGGRVVGPAIADGVPRQGERTAGEVTVFADGRNAFSFPAANLTDAERTRFVIGNSFFRRNWVEAPASTQARDGLGPHFIARSCGGCHVQDGRGAPPIDATGRGAGDQPVALLLRLSVPGIDAHGGPRPEPTYGDQFSNAAVTGVAREGDIALRFTPIKGAFADGTPYVLRKPHYGFRNLQFGPMARDVMVSPRVAPQLIGVGLLEAIPEAEIDANAVAQAALAGPVRGVPNRVWDAYTGREVVGRFGWKANVGTLSQQTGGAFVGDMGITSSRFPQEPCTPVQRDCLVAPRGHQGQGVEIDDETFDNIVFYEATLAPPARRNPDDPAVRRGERLFAEAGCVTCHRPRYVTAVPEHARVTSPALVGQEIWPYTDLLLHDMGPELADGRPDFLASGRQWKTPPLWGIGLIKGVNGHERLLHDGRANGVLEAILWHGGEAASARDRVLRMPRSDRAALVKFVESL